MDKQTIIDRLNIKSFYSSELPSIKWNGSGMGQALCPFHSDSHPSITVNERSGQFKCFGCDKKGSVFDFYMARHDVDYRTALNALAKEAGLTTETQKKIVKTYDYVDSEGGFVFQVLRYEPKDFRQRRPDGKGGWIWNLQGVQLVPYNLSQVIKSSYCIIVEGEKDCETLKELGFVASCNAQGAGKWRTEYSDHFKGKEIAIIPDNDDAGRKHALQIARSLKGIAKSLKIVKLPDLPEKGDISDWLHNAGDKEKFIEIVKATPEWIEPAETTAIKQGRLKLTGIADMLSAEPVKYLIDGVLVKDTLTMLSAYAATGKSLLSLAIAKSILTGDKLFDSLSVSETGSVLIIDEENPASFIKERLQGFGFTPELPLHFLHYQNIKIDDAVLFNELCGVIEQIKPKLVIIDSLIRIHGQKENEAGMSIIMGKLRNLVQLGTTVLLIHHHRKGAGDLKEGIRGHSDIIGGVDMAITLEQKEDYLLLSYAKSRTVSHEPIRLELQSSEGMFNFKCIGNEDSELIEVIHSILIKEPEGLKQSKILKTIKESGDFDYGDKKIRQVLRKGEGVYWDSHKGGQTGKAIIYRAKNEMRQCGNTIYKGNIATLDKSDPKELAALGINETLQNLDNSKCGNTAEGLKNDCHISKEVIEVLEVID